MMRSEQSVGALRQRRWALLEDVRLASLLLFVGSLLVRLAGLDRLPWTDEMYTMLAAQGWLSDGVPRIADGVYARAEWFTVLVAGFFRVFGESLIVARLPSLIAGSLLVVAVFLWTRRTIGTTAAWIAAAFLAFSPLAIQMAEYARFYALFGLLFWLGATGVYRLAEQRLSALATIAIASGTVACFLVALHLQVLALLGLVGIGLWLLAREGLPLIIAHRRRPLVWLGLALLAAAALAAAVALGMSGLAERLWQDYRSTPLHMLPYRNQVWFYHLQLVERYPTLWPIFPFLALLAASIWPAPIGFCLAIFACALTLLSFGGMKHLQYLFFVLPFLFVIWSASLAAVVTTLARWLDATIDRLLHRVVPDLPARPLRLGLIGASLLFLILSNGAPARTLLKPFGISLQQDAVLVDWSAARELLAPWLHDAAVVLSPVDVHTLFYIGRLDVVVNASRQTEFGGTEFSRDPRIGKVVVSTPQSVELVIDCFPSGLFLVDPVSWRDVLAVPRETARVIETRMTAIELPKDLDMLAFYWAHPETAAPPAACARLREVARAGGA